MTPDERITESEAENAALREQNAALLARVYDVRTLRETRTAGSQHGLHEVQSQLVVGMCSGGQPRA